MPLKLRRRLSAPALAALALAALLQGCGSTKPVDETAGWSPNRLYSEAIDERNAGNFERAVTLFERLEGRAAGTPLAQQAQLDKAYTHYKGDEPAKAQAAIDRFMRLHPASPALDYALYLKGLVNFNDNLGIFGTMSRQNLAERDQQASRDSYQSFKQLVDQFPDSKYSTEARVRMDYIVNALAENEIHVARYYYRRGAYVAAANRAQQAIQDYPQTPHGEEALYIMAQSYDKLGLVPLRDDADRVLKTNYPNSRFLKEGLRRAEKPWWQMW